jgi:hypothetical protein
MESIEHTLAFASKDWSLDKNDAWVYGVVLGWDDDALLELAEKFGWTDAQVARLKRLNDAWTALRKFLRGEK